MTITNIIKQGLAGKKLFITGGTGFFGKNILKYLSENEIQPERVTILTRNSAKFIAKHPEFANLNYITYQEADIRQLCPSDTSKYDYMIHAATSVVDQPSHSLLVDEIVIGTKNALEFALKSEVQSFINISSGAVYGLIDNVCQVTENFKSTPQIDKLQSSYGLGKLLAEHYSYLYSQQSSMKVATLRCFCFGGAYLDDEHYALGSFIKQALNNEDIIVKSGQGVYRSYLSANELVEWIFYLLINGKERQSKYEVFNVGSDEVISIPDLAVKVVKVLNSSSEVTLPNLANTDVNYYVPNIDKARSIGLSPKYTLDQIIKETAASRV